MVTNASCFNFSPSKAKPHGIIKSIFVSVFFYFFLLDKFQNQGIKELLHLEVYNFPCYLKSLTSNFKIICILDNPPSLPFSVSGVNSYRDLS